MRVRCTAVRTEERTDRPPAAAAEAMRRAISLPPRSTRQKPCAAPAPRVLRRVAADGLARVTATGSCRRRDRRAQPRQVELHARHRLVVVEHLAQLVVGGVDAVDGRTGRSCSAGGAASSRVIHLAQRVVAVSSKKPGNGGVVDEADALGGGPQDWAEPCVLEAVHPHVVFPFRRGRAWWRSRTGVLVCSGQLDAVWRVIGQNQLADRNAQRPARGVGEERRDEARVTSRKRSPSMGLQWSLKATRALAKRVVGRSIESKSDRSER